MAIVQNTYEENMYLYEIISEQNQIVSLEIHGFPQPIIKVVPLFVKDKKNCGGKIPPHEALLLFLPEGLAVGALIHGGVGLMGAHQNLVQRAIVFAVAVISAGLDGTFNTLVCVAVHILFLL